MEHNKIRAGVRNTHTEAHKTTQKIFKRVIILYPLDTAKSRRKKL